MDYLTFEQFKNNEDVVYTLSELQNKKKKKPHTVYFIIIVIFGGSVFPQMDEKIDFMEGWDKMRDLS